ncbi:MAG TPA: family 78 glycoside hydrolase catalytic domain, partial [Roseiflexaceae bacterium]|nr:family 78 glycoside hydrolase catalytic domain [Roseiflexaceae bacterium]
YDARHERPGWDTANYDDQSWYAVRVIPAGYTQLLPAAGPSVRATETVDPVTIITSPSGRTIVDFGQNLVGRLRINLQGQAGTTVTLRHAEVLEHGELGTRPLRHAAATDQYTLKGGEHETWEPLFTFHGFRYVDIEGWPGELRATDLQAIVYHSDMERIGWVECSDPLLNRLHENVVWSMRGNFFDIPTDCPQRDERLGWTGDIQVFAPTACFLYDTAAFLRSWLADLAAEQQSLRVVPLVVPTVMERANPPMAAWGDAATLVPWVLYERYGDRGILETQFNSMCAWVDQVAAAAGPRLLWDRGMQLGDWLDPSAPPDNPGAARTSPYVVATAYFARSAEVVALAADVLGRTAQAQQYHQLAAAVRAAFCREYVTPNGRILGDSATAYALAISFEVLRDPEQLRHAGERLVAVLRENGYHISTGFVGTPLICDALSRVGAHAAAFRLLIERGCPSWLYPVTMGATTIWERWDSMLPDGSINPGEMTSFNHYALGAVADWMQRTIAGLAPAAPGYRRIAIAPHIGGGVTHAHARHLTPYGPAEAGWRLAGATLTITAYIPPNTSAIVTLPDATTPFEIGPGSYSWQLAWQNSTNTAAHFTLESSLAELIEDQDRYDKLITFLHNRLPPQIAVMVERLAGRDDMTLRQAISVIPIPGVLDQVEPELTALLQQHA